MRGVRMPPELEAAITAWMTARLTPNTTAPKRCATYRAGVCKAKLGIPHFPALRFQSPSNRSRPEQLEQELDLIKEFQYFFSCLPSAFLYHLGIPILIPQDFYTSRIV